MLKAINGGREAILLEMCSLISIDQHPQESAVPEPIALLLAESVDGGSHFCVDYRSLNKVNP